MMQPPLDRIEQQNRTNQSAITLALDQVDDLIERVVKWIAAADALENLDLPFVDVRELEPLGERHAQRKMRKQ